MKSHDLNTLTLATASARGITFAEARRELGRRGNIVRAKNRKRTELDRIRAEHARALADRISP
jgi:hypothetical protein